MGGSRLCRRLRVAGAPVRRSLALPFAGRFAPVRRSLALPFAGRLRSRSQGPLGPFAGRFAPVDFGWVGRDDGVEMEVV